MKSINEVFLKKNIYLNFFYYLISAFYFFTENFLLKCLEILSKNLLEFTRTEIYPH